MTVMRKSPAAQRSRTRIRFAILFATGSLTLLGLTTVGSGGIASATAGPSTSAMRTSSVDAETIRVMPSGNGTARLPGGGAAPSAVFGPFNVRAAHSGKCMDVTGGPTAAGDGIRIQQYQCLGAAQTNQQWFFTETGDGVTYYLTAAHSGKCLDVTGGTAATGDTVPLQQYQCLGYGQSNQRWFLTSEDNGQTFNLRAAHSGKCADVTGGTAATGDTVPLQQYQCLGYGQSNQRWFLTSP
jgi:hypothetical protein